MNRAFTPWLDNLPLTALEVNSGPLSKRTCPGTPLTRNSVQSWSSTSCDVMLRLTTVAKRSLVYSSRMTRIRNPLPSEVLAATKS